MALRSLGMMLGNARETEIGSWAHRHQVFVLPVPSTAGVSPFSFRHGRRLMDEAAQLTEAWLPSARPVEAADGPTRGAIPQLDLPPS